MVAITYLRAYSRKLGQHLILARKGAFFMKKGHFFLSSGLRKLIPPN